ncbi:hypothetical protein [Stackebrandtia nassauensis]|uniref:hypothetical protein n=1 Tax=Stackebrandtia nassauensis TaxID=283811 RepID=UPI001185E220|nr:hypothetical protein [Stackebrandtia nassauensis]
MAAVDPADFDPHTRRAVAQRKLFLVPFVRDDGAIYVYVCTDPQHSQSTMVGLVLNEFGDNGGVNHIVYVLDGQDPKDRRRGLSHHQLRGIFPTWDEGIIAVLDAYDRWRQS